MIFNGNINYTRYYKWTRVLISGINYNYDKNINKYIPEKWRIISDICVDIKATFQCEISLVDFMKLTRGMYIIYVVMDNPQQRCYSSHCMELPVKDTRSAQRPCIIGSLVSYKATILTMGILSPILG